MEFINIQNPYPTKHIAPGRCAGTEHAQHSECPHQPDPPIESVTLSSQMERRRWVGPRECRHPLSGYRSSRTLKRERDASLPAESAPRLGRDAARDLVRFFESNKGSETEWGNGSELLHVISGIYGQSGRMRFVKSERDELLIKSDEL
jgi:hypothetical protein